MQSKAISAHSFHELKNKVQDLIQNSFQPTLAMVFTSPTYDLSIITNLFTQNNIDLFGLTTAGEIIDGEIKNTTIVALLMDMNRNFFHVNCTENKFETFFQTGKEAGRIAKNCFKNPALIIGSSGMTVNVEQIICGYKEVLTPDTPIFGGLAGDEWMLRETFAFTKDKITNNGIVTLVFDKDKIELEGMAICGWEAIGGVNTITSSEGNVVYKINNEPALDVFFKYFDSDDVKCVSAQYPLQIIRKDGTSVLRSPLMSDEKEKTFTLAGAVSDGDQFRFSIAPGFEVISQTVNEFGELKKIFPEADALILFSCIGRQAALGPFIEDEIKGIYDYWSTPMIGFFSYGEIGYVKGGTCDFHNETCSVILLKEKQILP